MTETSTILNDFTENLSAENQVRDTSSNIHDLALNFAKVLLEKNLQSSASELLENYSANYFSAVSYFELEFAEFTRAKQPVSPETQTDLRIQIEEELTEKSEEKSELDKLIEANNKVIATIEATAAGTAISEHVPKEEEILFPALDSQPITKKDELLDSPENDEKTDPLFQSEKFAEAQKSLLEAEENLSRQLEKIKVPDFKLDFEKETKTTEPTEPVEVPEKLDEEISETMAFSRSDLKDQLIAQEEVFEEVLTADETKSDIQEEVFEKELELPKFTPKAGTSNFRRSRKNK